MTAGSPGPLLLHGGRVLAPEDLGAQDVLTGGGTILAVGPPGSLDGHLGGDVARVDCTGLTIVPGLVDGHLHILGGGGGAGYASRAPELPADAILEAGITSCVGMPGLETVVKGPEALLARAYALAGSGIRTVVLAGGYHFPPPALTGSLRRDLYLVPHLVGVKIAMFEHVAVAPAGDDLIRLLRELEWSARATGKACILHVHLGSAPGDRSELLAALVASGASPERLQVTHANLTPANLEAAAEIGRYGSWVDVNPLSHPGRVAGSVHPSEAIAALLDAGVPAARITLSSDGNAPARVLPDGTPEAFDYHLWQLPAIRDLVERDVLPASAAIALATENPARVLRWDGTGGAAAGPAGVPTSGHAPGGSGAHPAVGQVATGFAADLVLIDGEYRVVHVVAAGRHVVAGGSALARSPFRDPRWT